MMMQANKMIRSTLAACALLCLVACGVPMKTFRIDAVDYSGNRVKCLVIVDSDWPTEAKKNVVYTPGEISIPIAKKVAFVQVKPADVGGDGKVVAIPQENDPSKYKIRGRDIQVGFPSKVTFVLELK